MVQVRLRYERVKFRKEAKLKKEQEMGHGGQ
jgi:hypothetical protein